MQSLGTGLSFISKKSPLSKSLYSSGFRAFRTETQTEKRHKRPHAVHNWWYFQKPSVFTTKNQHNPENFGAWRSLVARLLWEQDAAGSSPVISITKRSQRLLFLYCWHLDSKARYLLWAKCPSAHSVRLSEDNFGAAVEILWANCEQRISGTATGNAAN